MVNWVPVSCMPSPESPEKRMTTESRSSRSTGVVAVMPSIILVSRKAQVLRMYSGRGRLPSGRIVTQLTSLIVTPADAGAARGSGAGIHVARGDLRQGETAEDRRRHAPVSAGPISELSVGILAPAEGRELRGDAAGVGRSGADSGIDAPARDECRQDLLGRGVVAQLTGGVGTPAPGGAGVVDRAGERATRSEERRVGKEWRVVGSADNDE